MFTFWLFSWFLVRASYANDSHGRIRSERFAVVAKFLPATVDGEAKTLHPNEMQTLY
jgi:hypothetical protein